MVAQLPSRAIANVRDKLAAAGIGYGEIRWKDFLAMFFFELIITSTVQKIDVRSQKSPKMRR